MERGIAWLLRWLAVIEPTLPGPMPDPIGTRFMTTIKTLACQLAQRLRIAAPGCTPMASSGSAAVAATALLAIAAPVLAQPRITSFTADNRGQVIIDFDTDMRASDIENPQAITVYGAGPDGISGTSDDRLVTFTARLDPLNPRSLTVNANTDPDERYSFVLRSEFALSLAGVELDGEFNGPGVPSGNGQAGGDFAFYTRLPDGNPTARIVTNVGIIDIELYKGQTPLTVQNFFDYANSGVWDRTFVHRSIPDFVWQAGGYASNNFQRIDQNAPILNEPGISNTRGTIAMAKLSNNPNSATNEWFFNLVDNSANLDQQNSGFTVFGKVTNNAGLAIMDEIATYPRINAANINSAFSDLPVLDDSEFLDEEGEQIPEPDVRQKDLISIDRISILFDTIFEPFQSIDESQSYTFFGPDGSTARVSLFNLDGGPVVNPEGIAQVIFGSGNSINRITFLEPFSSSRIGVQISGASKVGSIIDKRSPGNNKLAFILCDAPLGTLNIRSLSGYDINQTRLPDGTILPADIDGDGQTGDPTALILSGGTLNQLRLSEDLTGSVIAEQGVRTIRVNGQTSDCTFVIDGPTTIVPTFTLGRVQNSTIDAPNHGIATIKAINWVGQEGQQIIARGIRTIQVTGLSSQGVQGNFYPNLVLSGLSGNTPTLSNATINGDVRDATWDITGSLGAVNIRYAASRWTLQTTGNIGTINAGRLAATNIVNSQFINRINTGEWNAGTLLANNIGSLIVRPNPGAQADGSFEANIQFQGTPLQPFSIGTLDFRGPVRNASIAIASNRIARNIYFRSTIDNSTITVSSKLSQFRALGLTRDTTLTVPNTDNITIGRWVGGTISAGTGTIRNLRTLGYNGEPGDLFANVTARSIQNTTLARGGSYKGTFDVDLPTSIMIQGDAVDSVFNLGATNLRSSVINQRIVVMGDMRYSRIQATGQLGLVALGGMIDSQILTGPTSIFNTVQTIPDSNPGLTTADQIKAVTVLGSNAIVTNSFVLTGILGSFSMNGVMIDNNDAPFGVAAGIINSFRVKLSNGLERFYYDTLPAPQAWGDFQIRAEFQIPTEQSQ